MGLDAYYNVLSQPSRTMLMFLCKNDIEFNKKELDLFAKAEHKTPAYLAINPHHTVPALVDNGFAICQSAAIIRYLTKKYNVADHWYPAEPMQRAKVDELLDWYPSTIRKQGVNVMFFISIAPYIGMPKLTQDDIDSRYKDLDEQLTVMENVYLKDQKFLTGDEITIADLFCANEVYQPTICGRDIFTTHPKLKAWLDRVVESMNPVWDKWIEEFTDFIKTLQTVN